MKYVYIAGPYTVGDVALNVRNAILAAEELRWRGYVPSVPHLTHLWHLVCPHEVQFWYDYDLEWLKKCDCLLRLPGESKGADREEAWAERWGMPVYHSMEEIPHVVQDPHWSKATPVVAPEEDWEKEEEN